MGLATGVSRRIQGRLKGKGSCAEQGQSQLERRKRKKMKDIEGTENQKYPRMRAVGFTSDFKDSRH